jgi:DNA ligase-1
MNKLTLSRSKTLLKVKSHSDAEAKVIGYQQPTATRVHLGEKSTLWCCYYSNEFTVRGLICEMKNGMVIVVNRGFSDEDRMNPPPIGSIITFKLVELIVHTTKKTTTASCNPRVNCQSSHLLKEFAMILNSNNCN